MKKPAVFMDRDGTLNEQMGYINHLDRFVLLPGTAEAVSRLNRAGFLTIVVTNQSGVARGYFPISLVHQVHDQMIEQLRQENAVIDGIYFCPHYPNGKVDPYGKTCDCRKPGVGLIQKAREDFDIDLERSFVVGDRVTDMEMAHRAGLKSILVLTGYGKGDLEHVLPEFPFQPNHVADDLLDATKWICGSKN